MNRFTKAIENRFIRNSMFESDAIDCQIYLDYDIWNKNSSLFSRRFSKNNDDISKAISLNLELQYDRNNLSKIL